MQNINIATLEKQNELLQKIDNVQPNILTQLQANRLDATVSSRQIQVLSQEQANRLDTNVLSRQANWGVTTTHRDRIDANISSRASQNLVDSINNKVDQLNNLLIDMKNNIEEQIVCSSDTVQYEDLEPVTTSFELGNTYAEKRFVCNRRGSLRIEFSASGYVNNTEIIVNGVIIPSNDIAVSIGSNIIVRVHRKTSNSFHYATLSNLRVCYDFINLNTLPVIDGSI
jgi:hypothetical protein